MPLGLVVQSRDGLIVYANQAAEEILGLTFDQMQGRASTDPRWRAIHEDGSDFPGEDHPAMVTLRSGQPVRDVVMGVFNPRSQSYTWINIEATPIFNRLGQPADQVMTTFENITQRKLAEVQQRRSEERFRSLVQSLESLIALEDYDGRILYINKYGAARFGGQPEMYTGKTLHEIFPAAAAGPQLQMIRSVIDTGRPVNTENRIPDQGRMRWYRTSIVPVLDEQGRATHVLINSTDIDDLKTAQQNLLELNHTLEERVAQRTAEVQDLYDNAPCGYHLLDAAGRVVRMNQTELDWLGRTREEVINRPFTDFMPADALPIYQANFPVYLQQGLIHDLALDMQRKDGSRQPVLVSATAIYDEAGRFVMSRSTVFDNSNRKAAEDALRESEANFRTFFETATDLLVVAALDGQILYTNLALAHALGYSTAELAEMRLLDLNPIAQRAEAEAILAEILRGERSSCPLPLQRKDGSLAPAEVRARLGRWNGRPAVFGMIQDLTAEREAQHRFESLFRNNPALMTVNNISDGRYLDVNQAFLEVTGYPPEEVLGKTIAEVGILADLDRFAEASRRLIGAGRLANFEMQIRCKNGTRRDGLFWGERLTGQLGDYLLIFMIDITERNQAQAALRASEETYRSLFDASNDAIFLLDLDSTYLALNPRAVELLGYRDGAQLIGRKASEFTDPSQAGDAQHRHDLLLADERVPAYECTFVRRDGSRVETEITLSLVRDHTGEPKQIQSVVRDISQRKQAEEALRQANLELERAMEMKDDFLACMSHELRTPLTGILGLSEALRYQVYGDMNEKQLYALANIESSGRHLLDLITDILDVAKIEAGMLELQTETCSLNEICQASLQLTTGMARKKGQKISYTAPPDPITLLADPRRLKQVLANLLSNAVKYSPAGASIGLEVRPGSPDAAIPDPGLVEIAVWDTGIGIAPDDLPRLFKPFVQVNSSLSRAQSGTGLGLVLVKRLVDLHGGRLQVESALGQGSRFTITLPLTAGTAPLEHPAVSSQLDPLPGPVQGKPAVIAIVDDHAANTIAIGDVLTSMNFSVVVYSNGQDFLDSLETARPDLALMDIQMPGIDGFETIRRLRAHPDRRLAAIPVIALTALAMPGDRERCL
ncbi:MAG: PAS domain S-box protein, partial [Chloroflexota bacterium]